MNVVLTLLLLPLMFSACTHFDRSSESGYKGNTKYQTFTERSHSLDYEARQTAYELGKDINALTPADFEDIQVRQQIHELERALSSKKDREQYSKVLPWLKNDAERLSFLKIPTIEGRQQWINKNNIWARSYLPQENMKELVDAQDIAVGMPQDYVRRSWGEPTSIEVSGNPIYKNERWKFQRQVSTGQGFRKETRLVYFEGGRVVGWETE